LYCAYWWQAARLQGVVVASLFGTTFFLRNTYQMDSWLNTIRMTSSFWAPCYYWLFYFSPSLVLFFPSWMYWSGTAYKGIFCFSPLSRSFTTDFCFSPPGSIDRIFIIVTLPLTLAHLTYPFHHYIHIQLGMSMKNNSLCIINSWIATHTVKFNDWLMKMLSNAT
jgi:hypothetical protein